MGANIRAAFVRAAALILQKGLKGMDGAANQDPRLGGLGAWPPTKELRRKFTGARPILFRFSCGLSISDIIPSPHPKDENDPTQSPRVGE
jgi:hypothetical protein